MAGAISLFGNVLFGLPSRANQINYDNTNSGLSATQVQAAIDELNGNLTNDHNKIVLNIWDSAHSENKYDANKANALFLAFNGWDSNITNFPTEATNQFGILETVWGNYNSIGDLTASRSQILTLDNGNVFTRSYDASLSTPWSAWQSGLTSKIGVSHTTNLNDCIKTGIYTFPWDATGAPSGHSGVMLVMRILTADTGLQITRVATENTIYVRFFDGAVFSTWQSLDVTKNGGGTSVDISGATFSNKYTFPADGYIYVSSESDTSGINKTAITGSNGITVAYIYQPISAANDVRSLYVRKGMQFYVVQKSANSAMRFTPLV